MKPVAHEVNRDLQAQLDRLAEARGFRPFKLNHSLSATPLTSTERPPFASLSHEEICHAVKPPPSPPKPVEAVLTCAETAQRLAGPIQHNLSPTGHRIYLLLLETALTVAAARGYSPKTTHVTFFCPSEVVAFTLGIHRCTLWRHTKHLKALGFIACREHKGSLDGQTVNDGTLWQLRLNPARGCRARLRYDELKYRWRDLDADVKAGRTAYNLLRKQMQQSISQQGTKEALDAVLLWALPPDNLQSPLLVTVAREASLTPEVILDLPAVTRNERSARVDQAAQAIAASLGDASSLNFYRLLLWNLLRRHDRGEDNFATVHNMIQRVITDYREGFAQSAGALLMSRLKQWNLWEELQRTPRFRVGVVTPTY